jgi:bifunctional polynucleotide phosphatase/kinase
MMGRPQKNDCRIYFTYNEEINLSKCNIADCNKSIKTNHNGNLERHLQTCHKEIYENLLKSRMDSESAEKDKSVKKIKIEMDSSTLLNACVEMVTVNGRPFTSMSDSGFRKIIDPILKGLDEESL